jgi:hypothetical protein
VAGQRLIRLTDPESPVLDELGMEYSDHRPASRRSAYRLVYEGTVRVYRNPHAVPVPARPVSKTPLWIGLGITLAGCGWAVAAGLLDRRAKTAL